MKNSFIIKNSDQSFDHHYQLIKKRKQMNTSSTFMNQEDVSMMKVPNKRPTARDGHTGLIF